MRYLTLVTAAILALGYNGSQSSLAAPAFDRAVVSSATSQSLVTEVGCVRRRICGVRGCVRRLVCW